MTERAGLLILNSGSETSLAVLASEPQLVRLSV